MGNFKEDLKSIKAFIFDIDGVLSTQTIVLNEDGLPMRTVNLRDGYAIQLAIKMGYIIAIISGGDSNAIKIRLQLLGVTDIMLKAHNKKKVYNDYIKSQGLLNNQVLYMGDDIPDFEVMTVAGIPVCPADADNEIIQISRYISNKKGGEGCVRDVIEQTLRLHGKWMNNKAFVW